MWSKTKHDFNQRYRYYYNSKYYSSIAQKSELGFLSELHDPAESVVSRCRIVAVAAEVSYLADFRSYVFRGHAVRVEKSSLHSNKVTSARCHLSFATKPPPTSNTLPFSVQDSWQRYATRGTTREGFTVFRTSGGITV